MPRRSLSLVLLYLSTCFAAASLASQCLAQEFVGDLSDGEKKIVAAIERPTMLEFVDWPLNEVVDYLGDFHDIEIQLDADALRRRGIGVDVPVTAEFHRVAFGRCLRLMLQRFGLTYTIYNGRVLLITTPALARRWKPEARFTLDAFIPDDAGPGLDPADAATLTTAIRTCIDREGWKLAESPNELIALPRAQPRSLIVTAPLAVQEQIGEVLADLERLAGPPPHGRSPDQAPSGVDKAVLTKVYRVDGPAEKPIDAVTKAVDPASWQSAGGPGALATVTLGSVHALLVSQTVENQRLIEAVLEQLPR